MLGLHGAQIVAARQQNKRAVTKHPGSKPGYVHQNKGRGNVWRATTTQLRSYPGWKMRFVRQAMAKRPGTQRTS
jgi:hypothetical protein